MTDEQLTLALGPACKERGCREPVVGSSITGTGHVCRRHNESEWGRALASYWPWMSRRLLAGVS